MESIPTGNCKECGCEFPKTRTDRIYCTTECRQRFNSRATDRARSVYERLIEWRLTRGQGVSGIAHEVDQWISEDRKAGRL